MTSRLGSNPMATKAAQLLEALNYHAEPGDEYSLEQREHGWCVMFSTIEKSQPSPVATISGARQIFEEADMTSVEKGVFEACGWEPALYRNVAGPNQPEPFAAPAFSGRLHAGMGNGEGSLFASENAKNNAERPTGETVNAETQGLMGHPDSSVAALATMYWQYSVCGFVGGMAMQDARASLKEAKTKRDCMVYEKGKGFRWRNRPYDDAPAPLETVMDMVAGLTGEDERHDMYNLTMAAEWCMALAAVIQDHVED